MKGVSLELLDYARMPLFAPPLVLVHSEGFDLPAVRRRAASWIRELRKVGGTFAVISRGDRGEIAWEFEAPRWAGARKAKRVAGQLRLEVRS